MTCGDGGLCASCDHSRIFVGYERAGYPGCGKPIDDARGTDNRTSPDGSVTVAVPCDEAAGELP